MKIVQSIDVFLNIQGCAEFIDLARLGVQLSENSDPAITALGAKVIAACGVMADAISSQISPGDYKPMEHDQKA